MAKKLTGVDTTLCEGVLTVTIDRPASMNALRVDTLMAVAEAIESEASSSEVRVAVLTGRGRAFCTGADLDGFKLSDSPSPDLIDVANRAVDAIRRCRVPVIAAVNGPAAGVGVSLALACDLTVAAESSYFLLAFTRVGLMPDGGATALVAASIGRARAMELALLADRVSAGQALNIGLITRVLPDASFEGELDQLVRQIVSGPAGAFARTKAAINDATLGELGSAFAREREGQLELLASADFAEGVHAFLGKRSPRFGIG